MIPGSLGVLLVVLNVAGLAAFIAALVSLWRCARSTARLLALARKYLERLEHVLAVLPAGGRPPRDR